MTVLVTALVLVLFIALIVLAERSDKPRSRSTGRTHGPMDGSTFWAGGFLGGGDGGGGG
jgi:hypothetical protein